MNLNTIREVAKELAVIAANYKASSSAPSREMLADAVLLAILRSRTHSSVSRQHRVHISRKRVPARIDFRVGGTNPVVIEFAVNNHGTELYGSQNVAELRKLLKIPKSKARLRVLLLADLSKRPPFTKAKIQATYRSILPGRGHAGHSPIRVLYVHKDTAFDFGWPT